MSNKIEKNIYTHLDNLTFEVGETVIGEENNRYTKVKAWIAHVDKNLNKSNFSKEMLQAMIPSLTYAPIVGYIQVGDDNVPDFAGHEERYIVDKDGVKTEYLGRMYGFVPADNDARFEKKTVNGIEREYLVTDGIMINKFAKATEILERDGSKGQSMELDRSSFDGYYDKVNDQFMVTSAEVEALCLLGDSRIPAMSGGSIEKTQFTNIRTELSSVFEKMEKDYMTKYSALKTNEENKKGGNELDIKTLEKMLVNYTLISNEFVEDLKGKLETFETEENLKEVLDAEQSTQFELTASAQMEILNREVSNLEVFIDRWGDKISKYGFKDVNIESSEVYAIDRSDYSDVGFEFIKNGDSYEIDKDSKFNISWQPVRLEEGQATNFSLKEEIDLLYEVADSKIEASKEDTKTEFESKLETQKVEFEKLVSEKDVELSDLRDYKFSIESDLKTSFVSSIENLEEVEKEDLIGRVSDFTMETLKDEIFKMIGKKSTKFSVEKIEDIKDDFKSHENDVEKKSYDHLMVK